jgi:O-succinylbenzoate synthase
MKAFPSNILRDFCVVSIPTKTSFRGISNREIALFQGDEGWSEFSPFLEYGAKESSTWLKAAIEAANRPWPKMYREKIEINATLPHVAVEKVKGILRSFEGCKTVKIKVNTFEDSAELVEETLNLIPDAKIRLDVNGSWSLEEALLHIYDFNLRFGKVFEYIEQPCESLSDLKKLKSEIPIKIAVDESIRKNIGSDFSNLHEIADIAILKWAPSGGITDAHSIAKDVNLPVVISSALDSGIGISHSLALAASFEKLEFACGLGTVALLESDICRPTVLPEGGALFVEKREPDFALLEKFRVSSQREEWWKNRVVESLAELGEI